MEGRHGRVNATVDCSPAPDNFGKNRRSIPQTLDIRFTRHRWHSQFPNVFGKLFVVEKGDASAARRHALSHAEADDGHFSRVHPLHPRGVGNAVGHVPDARAELDPRAKRFVVVGYAVHLAKNLARIAFCGGE